VRRGALQEEDLKALHAEATAKVREAGKEAEAAGVLGTSQRLSASTMFDDVYKEQPWHLRRQRQEAGV
jgi:2-oxoisovalerate dehydrogenase E1 component alpha subunit